MKHTIQITNSTYSFPQFILRHKNNYKLLLIIIIASYIQYILFKLFYPFPDFSLDSYNYIYAASANLDISIWPIGYSKFLRLLHFISHSDALVTGLQYALMQLAATYFFFTIDYFFTLKRTKRIILYIFLFFNPLSLYLSNYISSDALFAALSMFWFTHLVWIIQRTKLSQIFTQSVLLFLAFTVSNNAYYYPLLTALAFILSTRNALIKFAGAVAPLLLLIPFILFTRAAAKQMTGTAQYSLSTGWLIANNALYMYGHVPNDSTWFTSRETRELNQVCIKYFQPMGDEFYKYIQKYPANFFIEQPDSPLKQYYEARYNVSTIRKNTVSWGRVSPIFESFGEALLKKQPIAYARYFILPNAKNYFLPPLEKMALYNLGEDHVFAVAAHWFDYKALKIKVISKDIQGYVLLLNPVIFILSNAYFLYGLIIYAVRKRHHRKNTILTRHLVFITGFWLLNFFFSIFSTIIIFRYHAFPSIVIFSFGLLLYCHLNNKNPEKVNSSSELLEKESPATSEFLSFQNN